MITSLQIQNFRGLRHVELKDLRRVNLLIGGNDTGKTSILEALVLLLGDGASIQNLPVTFRTNPQGGLSSNDDREHFWPWLYYDRNPANRVEIVARTEANVPLSVEFRQQGGPMVDKSNLGRVVELVPHGAVNFSGTTYSDFQILILSTHPSNPLQDAENYNQVALNAASEERMLRIMQEVEPRVKRLRYAKLPGTNSPLVFVDIGLSRAVPTTQMGQAFNRIFHIYTHILAKSANVLLVDEIENGIFSESMPTIWRGLLAMCEQENVQIFATTHSRECVMAAHEAEKERGKEELSVQRIQRVKEQIEAVRLGSAHLDVASEMGMEVRS